MKILTLVAFIAVATAAPVARSLEEARQQDSPSVIQAVAPSYPETVTAPTSDAGFIVIIEVKIKPDGAVSSTRVVEGVGALAAAARTSARRWVFNRNGDRTFRTLRLTFVFRTMPANTPWEELLPVFVPPYQMEIRAHQSGVGAKKLEASLGKKES